MAVANSGLAMISWGLVTSKAKRCLPARLLTCILGVCLPTLFGQKRQSRH